MLSFPALATCWNSVPNCPHDSFLWHAVNKLIPHSLSCFYLTTIDIGSQFILIFSLRSLSLVVIPVIFLNIIISVVFMSFLVCVISSPASATYVIVGLAKLSYILLLYSLKRYLFFQNLLFKQPEVHYNNRQLKIPILSNPISDKRYASKIECTWFNFMVCKLGVMETFNSAKKKSVLPLIYL